MSNDQADHYVFKSEGGEIKLARVTAILGRVVRKPELERWHYWRTIDSISALVAEGGKGLDDMELRDIISDGMTLNEWLTLNRMRPEDYADEASGRGEAAHDALHQLASQQDSGEDLELSLANTIYQDQGGYVKGVADWWLEARPEVVATEKLLFSLKDGGYAGRCDLVASRTTLGPGMTQVGPQIIDLKTRKVPLTPYMTDELQLTMYAYAWQQMNPGIDAKPATSVLLVGPDGSYLKHDFDADLSVVPAILGLDRVLRKGVS